MTLSKPQNCTIEEQKILLSYLDTVWIDFDTLTEPQKEKEKVKKRTKKPGNK